MFSFVIIIRLFFLIKSFREHKNDIKLMYIHTTYFYSINLPDSILATTEVVIITILILQI
jgi:hypothetical protein